MKNKERGLVLILFTLIATLGLGLGYAVISDVTLNIKEGKATVSSNQNDFDVYFDSTVAPVITPDAVKNTTGTTATVTDKSNATFTLKGLEKKGDVATVTYTIKNDSKDLSAELTVNSTINTNSEYFSVVTELVDAVSGKVTLAKGNSTTVKVTVTVLKTPIDADEETTVTTSLNAKPVQP